MLKIKATVKAIVQEAKRRAMLLAKTNVARALNVPVSHIHEIQVWAFSVWVRGKNLCQLISWQKLIDAFNAFREAGAECVEVKVFDSVFGVVRAQALGSRLDSVYDLELGDRECWCSCEDYQRQANMFGSGSLCKHGWSLLDLLDRSPKPILSQQN